MLITIHGLPPNMRYSDVKALLKNKCGLINVILDNLVSEGTTKQVTVGVADEGDAAILVRKINGLYLNGCQLYVEDVRKKQPSDQPYRSSMYQQPAREPTPEPDLSGTMQQQMMMQQMMGQAAMARMYAAQTCHIATPQAPRAPYAAQTVPAYYVPVQPASYRVSDDVGDRSFDLGNQSYGRGNQSYVRGNQSYDRGNQGYDRGNQDYDLGNQTDRGSAKQSYDRGDVNKSFDRGSGNQSLDRGNPQSFRGNASQIIDRDDPIQSFDRVNRGGGNQTYDRGNPQSFVRKNVGQSVDRGNDRPRFDRGNPGQSFNRENAGLSTERGNDRPSFDRGNPGQSFNRGNAGLSTERGNDRPSFDRGNSGQSFYRGNAGLNTERGNDRPSFDRGNPSQGFNRGMTGSNADRGNVRPSFESGNPGLSFKRGITGPNYTDRENVSHGFEPENPIPGFDRKNAAQIFDRGDVAGNQSHERGNPSYDRSIQGYERGSPGYDRGAQSLDRSIQSLERGKQAYDRGDQSFDRGNASFNRNQSYDRGNQNVIDRPSDNRYCRSLSPSRSAARPIEEPQPHQSRLDRRKRSPSPRGAYPDDNGKRYQAEQRSEDRPPPYIETSTERSYPGKQGFNRESGHVQARPTIPPYGSHATERPGQAPRGPPHDELPGRSAPRQTAPKQEPYAPRQIAPNPRHNAPNPRQNAPNPRKNAPFVPKQNAPNPRQGAPFSKKNAVNAAGFAPKQNAPKPNAPPPTAVPKVPFPIRKESRLPPIPNPNQPPPSEDKIERWCKWGSLYITKEIRRKVHLRTFTQLETKIIQQQLRKAFMVICKMQWPPSKWWLISAYKTYYRVPGSYRNFIQATLGKIERGIFVLEEGPTRPIKVKVVKKKIQPRSPPPPVQELLYDPYQGSDPEVDPDFEEPVIIDKPIKQKVEPNKVPNIPTLRANYENRLPRFPNADKQIFKDIKKLLVLESQGEELYHLPPDQKAALREEIDKIIDIARAQCQDPPGDLEKKVFEYLTQEAFPEFDKSLTLSMTKRILNICTGLTFRIFFEPKPPNKDVLHAFLKQYGVISARKSDLNKFWIADVKDYEAFDKLCGISSVNLNGCTLRFKPLNVSGPSEKVIRKGKNALLREQQQQAKKIKKQQPYKLQLRNKEVVYNQPTAGTSKVKTENVKNTPKVKTEKQNTANVKTKNGQNSNAPKNTPSYGVNKPQIPNNIDFSEDNFDQDIASKNIDDFVLVDECNEDEEIAAPPEELEELEDFNLEVDEEDLVDYDL